ncbi:extracellular calcium-sensing receptor-like isoform X1 [Ascaphus truei]|uniref:extracellular calcium-sensing receptor-like isoform X1 n=2 Tax=Ascaphus truei TaxID=8439 RepID=UPI003F59CD2A
MRFENIFYRIALSIVFAIEEINSNHSFLPNITLGFSIYDSCDSVLKSLLRAMHLLTGQEEPVPNFRCKTHPPLAALIGEDKSSLSIPLARLLGVYRFPQISFASTVSVLSDTIQFPSFLRTVPSDDLQAVGIAKLMIHFKWTWIGILSDESDYGQQGTQTLKAEVEKAGVCIEFLLGIPTTYSSKRTEYIADVIGMSTAQVIVVFSSYYNFHPIIQEISRRNITGKTWIASDGWSTDYTLYTSFLNTLQGVLGFSNRRGNMPGFRDFLTSLHPSKNPKDIFIQDFWEEMFGCKLPVRNNLQDINVRLEGSVQFCGGNESLLEKDVLFLDMSDLTSSYNAYNAAYSIAHAIHGLISCKQGKGPFVNGSCATVDNFEPWQLLHYIKHVRFTNNNGEEVFYDSAGNAPGIYEITNWQIKRGETLQFVKVGRFDFTASVRKVLIINESAILWNGAKRKVPLSVCSNSCPPGYRKAIRPGKPLCCFDCILCDEGEISNQTDMTDCLKCLDEYWPNEQKNKCIKKSTEFLSYQEPLGAALGVAAVTIAVVPAIILLIFIMYRNTPIVKANNRELSYVLLIALLFSVFCALVFIGQPMNVTCIIRQIAFGIVFALSVSCILAKTIMVVLAFRATKPNSSMKRWIGPQLGNSIVVSSTSVQLILCTVWLCISPPFVERNTSYKLGTIIIQCNEGSTTAFWCMLGYMGLMAIVSFVVAFLSRKLPDSFNEANYITFSMLVFVTVWLSFIPAYLSTKGKYMVAVEVFSILSSSAGLISCIFFPKCYIILLRPDLNSKEFLMGRGASRTNKRK